MPVPKLSELIDQPHASEFLRGVVASRRYANAYLFQGPAGVGKGTAALAFARAILCDGGAARVPGEPGLFDAAPAEPAASAPADDACGACTTCTRAASLQHPDLRFLFPVEGEEKELDTTIAEIQQRLREDPLYVFDYQKAASIRLSLTRDLLRELAYRPYEAERRVVVVRDADRMREDQYSAMLKAIEEPASTTVWVLTTWRPNRLPATIRSRCQRVRFQAWSESSIATFLEARAGCDSRTAGLLAALAAGSLGRALSLRGSDPVAQQRDALALLAPARDRNAVALWLAAQRYMNYGRTGREKIRRTVEFHQLWLRDLLRAKYGAPELLTDRARAAELRAEAASLDPAEIRRRLLVLEEMMRAIDGNITPDVALFSGLARTGGSRMGEGEWPRHSTARWDY